MNVPGAMARHMVAEGSLGRRGCSRRKGRHCFPIHDARARHRWSAGNFAEFTTSGHGTENPSGTTSAVPGTPSVHELCTFDVIFHSDESSCYSSAPVALSSRIREAENPGPSPLWTRTVRPSGSQSSSHRGRFGDVRGSGRGIRSSAETRAAMSFFDTSRGQSCLF